MRLIQKHKRPEQTALWIKAFYFETLISLLKALFYILALLTLVKYTATQNNEAKFLESSNQVKCILKP